MLARSLNPRAIEEEQDEKRLKHKASANERPA
jgi:hypothetical protein